MSQAIRNLDSHEKHCPTCRECKGDADEHGHCEQGAAFYRIASALSAARAPAKPWADPKRHWRR